LTMGGWPDMEAQEVRFGIEIPKALSLLTHHDRNAMVIGLDQVERDQWPNVVVTRTAFQVMVGIGFMLIAVVSWFWWADWKRPRLPRLLLRVLILAGPLGFIALEAGWIVTEVGRQPWVIYKVMRTRDAVTSATGVATTLVGFTLLYAMLGTALTILLRRLAKNRQAEHG
ncbi:MAG: cytochrome ubiquinol oxidase subunit I, partial [Gemmatimonadota bacterium]